MTKEQLKEKYGDEVVMVLPSHVVRDYLDKPYSDIYEGIVIYHDPWCDFGCEEVMVDHLKPMPRWEAELNPEYRQVIPYGIVVQEDTEEILTTTRIGGDERLRGMLSIGTGGHMEEGETYRECLFRELREEVGLQREDITKCFVCGYICSSETEVDSVHLGLVYRVKTKRRDLKSREEDPLSAQFMTKTELQALAAEGKLESWSALALPDQMLWSKDGWNIQPHLKAEKA